MRLTKIIALITSIMLCISFTGCAKEKEAEVKENEAPKENTQKPSGKNKKRGQRAGTATLICFIAFILLYAVVNISSLSATMSGVMSVLAPIILGAGFAYLLNPILKFFEYKAFKWIKNKKILRTLSLICTYAVALGFFHRV